MSFTLQTIPNGSTDYEAIVEANRAATEDALNTLDAKVDSVGGEGAQLVLDTYDRDGVVGSASYRLDVANYVGGSQIVIGRRPVFDAAKGDQNVSIAFGTYGGVRTRVTLTGDHTLDAIAIASGLPKTIYIAIPSDGTPQFYEDAGLPNLVYVYSLSWNGFTLSQITQIGHILPGFTLIQEIAGAKTAERIYDGQTDWLVHSESKSTLVFGGDGSENEISVDVSRKVLGGFIACSGSEEGFFCPAGANKLLTLELWDDQDRRWNLEPIQIDCSATPTRLFFSIDPAIGTDVFVTDVAEFRLVRTALGADIASARGFSWGLYTQAVIGTAIPKDSTKVDGI